MKVRDILLLLFTLLASPVFGAILGIDLGQDFTKAVLVAPGVSFEIVMSADSKRKDVSGIAFKPLGKEGDVERIYGSATATHCTRFPASCVLNYKPLLGRHADDLAVTNYLISHSGVNIVESNNNRSTIAFNIDNHKYPIEEVLAMNIQNIVSRASALLKEKSPGGYSQINGVAVTVPSFFSQSQRYAIRDAIELAGLPVVALVDDGLAIAVNYATKTEFEIGKEYHIIYDMGAGSTAATLVSFNKIDDKTPVEVSVEGYSYDESLGGSYFTDKLAEIVKSRFLSNNPKISTDKFQANHRAMAKVHQASERAKLILSANNEASISIESLIDEIDFKTKVSREEYEDFLTDISTRITDPIRDAIKNQFESSVKLEDIKSVIYAGGATRVPFVQQHLLSLIGEELVSRTINADEAAVLGTTLRAVQISKMFKARELNVTERSIVNFRIAIDDGEEDVVFPVGSQYDTVKELNFTESIIKNNKLSFDLIEGIHRYSHHESADLEDIKSKFTFNESDCSSIAYIGKFGLSESRIFNFNGLEAICYNGNETNEEKSGFLDKFKTKQNAESGSKILKKSVIPLKTKYLSSRPLGSSSKLELRTHLQTLNSKDQQRALFHEKLNELEALLYNTRSYLDETEVIEKGPESVIKQANSLVTEFLEWLDYESDRARLKDVKDKIESVKKLVKQIKDYVDQSSVPLDGEEFKRIHKEGVLATNSIQETLMTSGEESLALAKKFAEVGLDYEKESSKLTKAARDFSTSKFETVSKALTKTFEKVKEVYEADEDESLEEYTRETLFALREEALAILEEVQKTEEQLKKVHAQRMKELNNALARYNKAQKRAADKAAAKAKAEEEKALEEEIEEPVLEVQIEEAPSSAGDEEPVINIKPQRAEHDEL